MVFGEKSFKFVKKLLQIVFIVLSCFVFAFLAIYRIIRKWSCRPSKHHQNPFKQTHEDVFKHRSQVIKLQGFQITEYEFKTKDNAYVSFWRVQKLDKCFKKQEKLREIVLIQHGLLDCSMSWFLHRNKSNCLPYMLADQNYDVWVGNNRGNKYSTRNSDKLGYWEYCFDDLVQYDLPTMIQGILSETKAQKLIYIGHSQGTAMFLTGLGVHAQLKTKIKMFIGLGSIIGINHLSNNFILDIVSKTRVLKILKNIGFKALFILPLWMSKIIAVLISNIPQFSNFVYQIIMKLCGKTQKVNFDLDRFGVMMAHQPGGASLNNVLQWIQFYVMKKTTKFDYGKKKNLLKYSSETPPQYTYHHLNELPFHCYLFVGNKDGVIAQNDFNFLVQNLKESETTVYQLEDYGHLDYVWGINAHLDIYMRIVQIIQSLGKQQQVFSTQDSEDNKRLRQL